MTLRLPNEKIATVFGGTGFIGRYVVHAMARRGWRVRVATRDPGAALFLKPYGMVGQVTPEFANTRDDATVAAVVADSDYVVNLVGILYEKGRRTFQALHVDGARRVAEAAARAGVPRLVHVSAIGADPAAEAAYARSKAEGEQAVRQAFPDAVILRPSIVFGAEDDFFNRFAAMSRISPALPLIGGGTTRFQPVYVGDVADAVLAGLDRPDARGRTFELGGPQVYTFAELMKLMLRVIGRKRRLVTVPWGMARFQAKLLGLLPVPPLTLDQLAMLKTDNVVADGAATLSDLGIAPTQAEIVLPTYLQRYRVGGRFAGRHAPGLHRRAD